MRKAAQECAQAVKKMQDAGEIVGPTLMSTAMAAVEKAEVLEEAHLPKLKSLAGKNIMSTTDAGVKSALKSMAAPFSDLEQQYTALKAILKPKKPAKKEPKREPQ